MDTSQIGTRRGSSGGVPRCRLNLRLHADRLAVSGRRVFRHGVAHNLSITLFGSTGPYVSTWLVDKTGNPIAPGWYLVVATFISLTVAGTALRGRSLSP